MYKVLWFDDEHETLEMIKDDALDFGIELIGYSNASEGINELKENHRQYDSIIVDGLFYEDKEQNKENISEQAFGRVAITIKELKSKGIIIPWFIYSGQKSFVKNNNRFVKLFKNDEYANGRVFDKNNSDDLKQLCDAIKEASNNIGYTIIRNKYKRIFEVCTDEYIGVKTNNSLLEIISNLDKEITDSEDLFNKLRKILENIFTSLISKKLVPPKLSSLNQISLFLSGNHNEYKFKETIINSTLTLIMYDFIRIVQDTSHDTPEHSKIKVSEHLNYTGTSYLYKSTIYQLLEIIIWYKKFVDDYTELNKISPIWIELNSPTSNVITDNNNSKIMQGSVINYNEIKGFAFFKPDIGNTNYYISKFIINKYNLKENQLVIAEVEEYNDNRTGEKKVRVKQILNN